MSEQLDGEDIVIPPLGAKGKAVVAAFVWLAALFGTVIAQGLLHGSALHYASVFIVLVGMIAGVTGVHQVPNTVQHKKVARRKSSKPHP